LQLVKYAVDISIIDVLVTPPNIRIDEAATLIVIVKNLGLTTQTFNLLVYLDGELIKKFENITLIGSSGDMFFVTLPVFSDPGEYTLNCTIPAVPNEEQLQNNVYTTVLKVGLLTAQFPFEVGVILAVIVIVVLVAAALYLRRRF